MGTLFEQPKRDGNIVMATSLNFCIEYFKEVAKEHNISLNQVIEINKFLEQKRTNNLKWHDNDIKDEQLSGFGEILKSISNSLETLADKL